MPRPRTPEPSLIAAVGLAALLLPAALALREAAPAARAQAPAARAPAPAREPGQVSARVAGHGPGWVDARAFGVSPANPDNGPALQAAIRAASALPGGTVFVPAAASPYHIKTPVYVNAAISLRGEGSSTRFAGPTQSAAPLFYVGVGGDPVGPAHRPDLFGKLDASAATAPGQRAGLRTRGGGYVASQASPLSHGPVSAVDGLPTGWYDVRQVTIDFAVEGFANGHLPGGLSLWGVGDVSHAYPFALKTYAANAFQFSWFTQAAKFGPATPHSVMFTTGDATGVQRIAIQLDLAGGSIQVYANGKQLPTSGDPPEAGSTFAENIYHAFLVNATGQGGQSAGGDFGLYGLCMVPYPRYAHRGAGKAQLANPQIGGLIAAGNGTIYLVVPGNPTGGTFTLTIGGVTSAPIPGNATTAQLQAALRGMSSVGGNLAVAEISRLPTGNVYRIVGSGNAAFHLGPVPGTCDGSALRGQSLGDLYRYFPQFGYWPYIIDLAVIGYLPLQEDRAAGALDLAWQGGTAANLNAGSALFRAAGTAHVVGASFRDFSVGLTNATYGAPFVIGDVLSLSCEGVGFGGGAYGLCWSMQGANYPVRLRDCGVGGNLAGLFAFMSDLHLSGLGTANVSRHGVLVVGCNLFVDGFWVSGESGSPYSVIAAYGAGYGGIYRINDVECDFEGGAALRQGLLYFEPTAFAETSVHVSTVYGGIVGDAPLIRLSCQSGPPIFPAATLTADDVRGDSPAAVVAVDGPLWRGEVRGSYGDDTTYVVGGDGPARPAVRAIDERSRTFPRWGRSAWRKGTVEVRPPAPADGQYERLRVAADGVHGSTRPPRWAGLDALRSSPSSLAAYAIDHASIAATVSGRASAQGFLTETAGVALANALFAGKPLGAPTTWYVGLLTRAGAGNGQWIVEVPAKGTGYARAALPNTPASFAPARAGSKASTVAVAWPAATSAYSARAVGLYTTPEGGTPWVVLNLASPVDVAPGQAASIPAGALTFAHVPYGGDFAGGLTDHGWGRCYDALFGGADLGAPAAWHAALSTATTSRTTTAPAEPVGAGYARAAVPAGGWLVGSGRSGAANDQASPPGEARNAAAVAFAEPTGPWGNLVAVALIDAPSGGVAWFQAPLVAPAAPDVGREAPAFAPEALVPAVR